MTELLDFSIEAHGGRARWDKIRTVSVELSITGALWDLKGKTGIFEDSRYEAEVHSLRATLGRFTAPDRRVCFTPEELVLETDAGQLIKTRSNPRKAFAGHTVDTALG